jgi:drug/metabolite transporter (DMT)-like permease
LSAALAAGHAERRIALALMFVAPALWSANYLVARWAPGAIAPHMLALCRWSVAAALLGAFCWREIAAKREHVRRESLRFLVLGALGMWICGAFVYIGARHTTAINIGLLYAVSPVLIALVSALWMHERFGAWQWAGVALALGGVMHIVIKGQWQALGALAANPGDAWIALCVVAWTVYSLLLRIWTSAFGALARLTLIACAGVLVLLPFTLIESLWWWPSTLSWKSVALVLVAALLPGAGAYGAYSFMQRVLGAARVGVVLYLAPLYAALAGWVVLGEPIEPFHLAGAALILPGIWLASRR